MKKWIFSLLMLCGTVSAAPQEDGLYATLQTTMGDVCFELCYINAPRTVANFVSLAEGTRPWIDPRTTFVSTKPYYNGLTFHRVIDGFMIQCGSPKGDGTDGPGYSFQDEFDPALRHDRPGIVSMANSGPNSNGGQFFITVTNTPHLNDAHSVFGAVVEGMDVVSNIAAVAMDANKRPLEDVVITNVFITRNGTNAASFAFANQALPEVRVLPISISPGSGLSVSMGVATSCYQTIYSSTNLADWSEKTSGYWPNATSNWSEQITLLDREYFRANQVVYPPDTNMPQTIAGHFIITETPNISESGSAIIKFSPESGNGGTAQYNQFSPDNITEWIWSEDGPYEKTLFVLTDFPDAYTVFFYYYTPTNGACVSYYNGGSGWQQLETGRGTFTDEVLP